MNIAMIFDGLGFGGIERVGTTYAKLLIDLGHNVTIINLQPDRHELKKDFSEKCEFVDVRFSETFLPDRYFPVLRKWRSGKYIYPLVFLISKYALFIKRTYYRMFKHQKTDIAIAFSGHIRDLSFVGYDFIKSNKKLTWLHGSLSDYLLLSYSFADLYSRITNLCVLSTNNQSYAFEVFPKLRNDLNIAKIYNPVEQHPSNLDHALIEKLKEEYSSPLIMVGRFDADKDQFTVIRAMHILRKKHSTEKDLIFIGDGPRRSECEELVKTLHLEDCIHFLGFKRNVDNYYQASCISVHSSPAEGLPTVLLESMRNGLPIVATKSLPGVAEILEGDRYGLTCQVGDPEDMADKIYELLSNDDLQKYYSDMGYERIKAFSPETIESKLLQILNNLK